MISSWCHHTFFWCHSYWGEQIRMQYRFGLKVLFLICLDPCPLYMTNHCIYFHLILYLTPLLIEWIASSLKGISSLFMKELSWSFLKELVFVIRCKRKDFIYWIFTLLLVVFIYKLLLTCLFKNSKYNITSVYLS